MSTPFRLLLVIPLLLAASCAAPEPAPDAIGESSESAPSNERVVRVEVLELTPTTFEDVIQLTGTAEAPNDATLSAQSGGTIVELAQLGRRVSKGEVVARVDDDLIRAVLQQARAQLDVASSQRLLAQDLYDRQAPLFRDSIISAVEFENVRSQLVQSEAGVSQSEAAVSQAEKQLENTLVRAPFAGIVEERFVEQGEQAQPGAPMLRIVDTGTIRIAAGVPERYASDVQRGADVTVRFQDDSIQERRGSVGFAGQVINPSSRTFRIEVELDNRDGLVKPAMIANLFITRARLEDRLVIPQTAIMRDEFGSTVFVVTSQSGRDRTERRSITLGPSYRGRTVVEQGLAPGDRVITVGQTNVTDGDAIDIVTTETRQ